DSASLEFKRKILKVFRYLTSINEKELHQSLLFISTFSLPV
ncbi:MAG: hypothetical protein ACI8VY_001618, partial [Cellvibrionaceae bacterium]